MISTYQSFSTILAYHDILVGSCLGNQVVGALLDGYCSVLHKAIPELGHGRTPSSLVRKKKKCPFSSLFRPFPRLTIPKTNFFFLGVTGDVEQESYCFTEP
jgi:hypothetical protein